MSMIQKLTPKQRLFAKEYLVDLDATKAATRAGYGSKNAASIGCRLVKKSQVKKLIEEAMAAREERIECSRDKWLRELMIIGFSDLADYIEIDADTGAIRARSFDEEDMPKNASRALESITENRTVSEGAKGDRSIVNEKVTFKLHPKLRALEVIGEYLGFINRKATLDLPGVERALYELSEKFLPAVGRGGAKNPGRGHAPK